VFSGALSGTQIVIDVVFQLTTTAICPLTETVLAFWTEPNPVPEIVTRVPGVLLDGDMPVSANPETTTVVAAEVAGVR
jgi:hypothetical protein